MVHWQRLEWLQHFLLLEPISNFFSTFFLFSKLNKGLVFYSNSCGPIHEKTRPQPTQGHTVLPSWIDSILKCPPMTPRLESLAQKFQKWTDSEHFYGFWYFKSLINSRANAKTINDDSKIEMTPTQKPFKTYFQV